MWGLLADGPADGKMVGLMALSSLFGAGVQWLAGYYTSRRTARRKERQEDDEHEHLRLVDINRRLDEDRRAAVEEVREVRREMAAMEREFRREITALQAEVRRNEIRSERAIVHIRHLEAALEKAEAPYPRWEEPAGDTGTHAPLTPPPEKPR